MTRRIPLLWQLCWQCDDDLFLSLSLMTLHFSSVPDSNEHMCEQAVMETQDSSAFNKVSLSTVSLLFVVLKCCLFMNNFVSIIPSLQQHFSTSFLGQSQLPSSASPQGGNPSGTLDGKLPQVWGAYWLTTGPPSLTQTRVDAHDSPWKW